MASKFSEFLTTQKIHPRRLIIASKKVEGLRPEDRTIRQTERKLRRSEDGMPAKKEGEVRVKPRSGRPVTQRSLDAAVSGRPLTGPSKTRILRAVNRILEQRKAQPVDIRALF